MKGFNINNYVLVKLTDIGYKAWYDHVHALDHVYKSNETIETLQAKADGNGYVKFQTWNFMRIFGQMMKMGFNMPFDSEILIDDEYLISK